MEKLNLVEILKNYPKGTKLYSPALGECALEGVNDNNDYPIKVKYKIINNDTRFDYFTKYGYLLINKPDAECMLFPSKDQRDWSKWQRPFVKGDILVSEKGNIVLCSHIDEEQVVHFHCILNFQGNFEIYNGTGVGYSYKCTLANDFQKQRLFDALKKEGYEWDDTTKTLEKLITSKFKDEDEIHLWTIQDAKEGDVLAINWYEGYDYWEKIVIFKKYHNEGANSPCVEGYGNTFKNRKLAFHEEVPRFSKTWTSCLELATKEQRDLLFQTIKEAGYKWNPETKTLEKLIKPNFKDGDIVATNDGKYIAIIKNNGGKYYVCCHPNVNYFYIDRSGWFDRLATLEEKEKLFAAIKENGYKWNAKTKTLEKLIVPKFKVGDKIKHKDTILTIITVRTDDYIVEDNPYNFGILMFSTQDNWELVSNKFDKFDISTLIPYESKVLIRNTIGGYWQPAFWGAYTIDKSNRFQHHNYLTTKGFTHYCIPYDGNEHLIGKTDDCCDFYKTWEG